MGLDHTAVTEAVRSWYTGPTPELGISAVEAPYGFLMSSDRLDLRRLVLTADTPSAAADAVAAATMFFGTIEFELWIDDRVRAERLTAAVGTAGYLPVQDTVVLALLGAVRAGAGPPGLRIDDVTDVESLRAWATVKLQGFADSEAPPRPEQLQSELVVRQAEWPVCRYQLARLDGEPVGILGHYTGQDQMVFLLATRLPFRHRGIAQAMLACWQRQSEEADVRSLLINCDDGGRAHALYRRLGFSTEVYWHRRYRVQPPAA